MLVLKEKPVDRATFTLFRLYCIWNEYDANGFINVPFVTVYLSLLLKKKFFESLNGVMYKIPIKLCKLESVKRK